MGLKREKKWSRVLSCLGGSPSVTDDSDDLTGRRKSQLPLWTRFRAKKKTVPVDDAATENALIVATGKHEKMPPAKKGFFKILHKDKGKKRPALNPQLPASDSTQVASGSDKSPAHHVIFNRQPDAQPATHFAVSGSVQAGTKTNHTPSLSTICRAQNKKNKMRMMMMMMKGGESGMGDGLIVLAMALGTLLLGGRVVAIVCMSAFFYILRYFRMTAVSSVRKKSCASEIETSSEQTRRRWWQYKDCLKRIAEYFI